MYDSWDSINEDSRSFIQDIFKLESFEEEYISTQQEEKELKNLLINFEQDYPNVTNQDNVNDILKNLEKKVKSTSSLSDIIEHGQERYETQKEKNKKSIPLKSKESSRDDI